MVQEKKSHHARTIAKRLRNICPIFQKKVNQQFNLIIYLIYFRINCRIILINKLRQNLIYEPCLNAVQTWQSLIANFNDPSGTVRRSVEWESYNQTFQFTTTLIKIYSNIVFLNIQLRHIQGQNMILVKSSVDFDPLLEIAINIWNRAQTKKIHSQTFIPSLVSRFNDFLFEPQLRHHIPNGFYTRPGTCMFKLRTRWRCYAANA